MRMPTPGFAAGGVGCQRRTVPGNSCKVLETFEAEVKEVKYAIYNK